MALSKSNRIIILLIIDTAFFLLELIVGKANPRNLLLSAGLLDENALTLRQVIPLNHSLSWQIPFTWYEFASMPKLRSRGGSFLTTLFS